MTNDYSHLDTFTVVPFILPPIACGEYSVTDDFGDAHKFHFRRMPRARRHTGRYGVFYHDADAHWQLVGWVNDEGQFVYPEWQDKRWFPRLGLFLLQKKKLEIQRCCWCGRMLTKDDGELIHAKEVCSKNLRKS